MEGELWNGLYPWVARLGKRYRQRRTQFSNTTIVLVLLWAVMHDRPISWACRQENWPPRERCWPKPSPATMSRRLRKVLLLTLLVALARALRERLPCGMVKTIDAKPLPVGGFSKDRDARMGWAATCKMRGYKIFGVCDTRGGGALDAWSLGPMNQSEPRTAAQLVSKVQGGGYLLGDALYDSNPLHEAVSGEGWQLIAPRKKPDAGLGHRRHHPARLRSIELLGHPFGRDLYAIRTRIERHLGQWGNYGGGLSPLPNWVRRPRRVALWVQGKIILNQVRLILQKPEVAA